MVAYLVYFVNLIGYLSASSLFSTGVTSFHWVPLKSDAYSSAVENATQQEDCALKCLAQSEDLSSPFCYGFAIDNAECTVFEKPSVTYMKLYSALYNLTNYMNAATNSNESCEWTYDYLEVPASARQTVFYGSHYVLEAVSLFNSACYTECQQIGFEMVSIHSVDQNVFVLDIVKGVPVHLGLFRNESFVDVHVFYWSDGTMYTYGNWNTDEPNDSGGDENCVVSCKKSTGLTTFKWTPIKGAITVTQKSPNAEQRNTCALGCLQRSANTTNDYCAAFGYVSSNDSCVFFRNEIYAINGSMTYGIGSYFKVVNYMNSPQNHNNACLAQELNNDFLFGNEHYLGLFKNATGNWFWHDGAPVDYFNWDQGEPNYSNGDCVVAQKKGRPWRMEGCGRYIGCMCTRDIEWLPKE